MLRTLRMSAFAILIALTLGGAAQAATPAVIKGTAQGDDIQGTLGGDRIYGFAGNDEIDGRGGSDVIFGGPGNDTLSGGGGKDYLAGEEGTTHCQPDTSKIARSTSSHAAQATISSSSQTCQRPIAAGCDACLTALPVVANQCASRDKEPPPGSWLSCPPASSARSSIRG